MKSAPNLEFECAFRPGCRQGSTGSIYCSNCIFERSGYCTESDFERYYVRPRRRFCYYEYLYDRHRGLSRIERKFWSRNCFSRL